jgi:hypothetical protein
MVFAALAFACFVGGARDAAAQLIPYPLKDCQAVAKDLEAAVPIAGPFSTEIQWFREGDLGIKGRQCRIAAEGAASVKAGKPQDPKLEDMVGFVSGVLEKHGFKKNEMVDRYTRKGEAYRAFAMRKDRVTCWTNVEFQIPSTAIGKGKEPAAKPRRNWSLSVECFMG